MKVIKYLSKSSIVIFLSIVIIAPVLLIGCKKNTADPVIKPPVIRAISIDHGPFNTTVVITGVNFGSTASDNIVKFNGVSATVTNAAAGELTVKVPVRAGTGNISLSVNGTEVSGPVFTYEYTTTVSTISEDYPSAINPYPTGVAVDDQYNIYVADETNNQVRKIDASGKVSILAGDSTGDDGFVDGMGTAAKFNYPYALEVDRQGIVYVADLNNHSIRKISPAGLVTTLAGDGFAGNKDGPGTTARFNFPDGIAVDEQGNVYASDRDNYNIRIITPAGVVSSWLAEPFDGPFSSPHGLIVNSNGNLDVADDYKNRFVKLLPGNGWFEYGSAYGGYADGPIGGAAFTRPSDIVSDSSGNIYIADAGNNRIRKMTPDGMVSTLAGNGIKGLVNGSASTAQFNNPLGIAIDKLGNIYVADAGNYTIRKITIQ